MSKPSVLGGIVNRYTYESHLGQFVAKFVRVEGVVGGHVLIVVDLAAWLYMSTGQAAAAVLREIPSNLGEVTFAWLLQTVAKCDKLVEELKLLRKCVEKIARDFKAKGASVVTLRFVASCARGARSRRKSSVTASRWTRSALRVSAPRCTRRSKTWGVSWIGGGSAAEGLRDGTGWR